MQKFDFYWNSILIIEKLWIKRESTKSAEKINRNINDRIKVKQVNEFNLHIVMSHMRISFLKEFIYTKGRKIVVDDNSQLEQRAMSDGCFDFIGDKCVRVWARTSATFVCFVSSAEIPSRERVDANNEAPLIRPRN